MRRVEWSIPEAVEHMLADHGVTPVEATEAALDIAALVWPPDPASLSGLTDRIVGYSQTGRPGAGRDRVPR